MRWLPPSDWAHSARDALWLMGFADQSDWSLPRLLCRRGKFVADGRFDPRARSQQCGAAVMLKVLANADELAEI